MPARRSPCGEAIPQFQDCIGITIDDDCRRWRHAAVNESSGTDPTVITERVKPNSFTFSFENVHDSSRLPKLAGTTSVGDNVDRQLDTSINCSCVRAVWITRMPIDLEIAATPRAGPLLESQTPRKRHSQNRFRRQPRETQPIDSRVSPG